MDIVVCRVREFIIYIENKVWAVEGGDQLGREYRDMTWLAESFGIPDGRQFAVFLTPSGRSPTTAGSTRWRSLGYQELARDFAAVVRHMGDQKSRLLAEDWLHTIRSWYRR